MEWFNIATAPTDGQEFLVCDMRQGGVMKLVNWDVIHNYWQSKGVPERSVTVHWTHWARITKPEGV